MSLFNPDYFGGTSFGAFSAAVALCLVDSCEVVDYGNGARFADGNALLTTDTALFTSDSNVLTLTL